MTQDELLDYYVESARRRVLEDNQIKVMELLMEDRRKAAELEEAKNDNKKRRIADWVKWAIGGLAGGALAWVTFYYEDNGFISGSRGRILGKMVDKAIFRKN